MSIFCRLGHLSKRIHPGPMFFMNFCNNFVFLWWGIVSPTPNPQAGGPPSVVCPRFLIPYISSYLPKTIGTKLQCSWQMYQPLYIIKTIRFFF
jgi:hypothetical protein